MMHHGLASQWEDGLGHIEGEGPEAGACTSPEAIKRWILNAFFKTPNL